MKRPLIAAIVALPLALYLSTSHAVQIMRWERLPLTIPLLVGQERVIFIDRNVRIGVPSSVSDRLRIQSAAGTVYLRANEPIEPTRLQLQDAVTGELILLDIAADSAGPEQVQLEDIRIVEERVRNQRSQLVASQDVKASKAQPPLTPVPVVLTRYAAQNLFAPLRTVEALQGVRRVNVAADLSLDLLMPSVPVDAKALAAWRLDDYWVTAVRLTNRTSATVDLDPRVLLGDFVAATFQHHYLGARGMPTDTSVVYLTTRGQGLGQSLLPTISPVDATLNVPPVNRAVTREADHEK
ncbi:TIGR03749 family integrating conjugative element protein [Pseudomonas koreensis]|uniref:TIGR03749 family integrating conjugative element protein n=1 Tax=Pseudomonas koreensis TaxID=198620 RepID=A0A9X3BA97_9PSED|nr:TIGR03749 family integrating conjugative element protein [Pseudomonas koreensis]MCU7247295.1 TIGR03749 family integrating conjugative element protein [Pseudomonas koreensis]